MTIESAHSPDKGTGGNGEHVRAAQAPLWTAVQAARATRGRVQGTWQATGVSIDSRSLRPGDLFIALKGPNHDGHDHVAQALAAGAAGAVISRPCDGVPGTAPTLLVTDTYRALVDLAEAARMRSSAKRIAITGSVGKTGTKSLMARGLAALGETHASRASHNNAFGVPLSLAALPADADFGVFEIGMNHAGEIRPLTRLVRPDVAVVTGVAATHLGHFDDEEAIADAKAELFEGLTTDGTVILNHDNRHYPRLRAAALHLGLRNFVSFGTGAEADIRLTDVATKSWGLQVTAHCRGTVLMYRLSLHGRHWAMNSLMVAAAAVALNRDPAAAVRALEGMEAPPGRGARHHVPRKGGHALLIDDSYNASPVSVRAALEVLATAPIGPGGRRIAALGDMLELGDQEAALHAGLAADVIRAGVDAVYLVGPRMLHLKRKLGRALPVRHDETAAAAAEQLDSDLSAGDAVLVKGSLGSRMGLIVARLRAREQSGEQDRERKRGRHAV